MGFFLDKLNVLSSGAKYVVVETSSFLIGTVGGKIVRSFNDVVGITRAAEKADEHVQTVTATANRAIDRTMNLGGQAVANATDIADRATTNLTGLTLVAANHAATLGHRGLREVETWGDFLRSHTIATTAFIGGIASEVVAVTMHRAYNELCEGSTGTLCSGLSDATLTMYKTGIVCIMVSSAYLFYIIKSNKVAPNRPTLIPPQQVHQSAENRDVLASQNPSTVIDRVLIQNVNLSASSVERVMQSPVTASSGEATKSVSQTHSTKVEDSWSDENAQIEQALINAKKRRINRVN